eukprot:1784446-Amphidinium_carterae.1
MSRQDCRKLDKVKQKPRFYGFRSANLGEPSSASASSQGGALGGAAAAADAGGLAGYRQTSGT